MAIWRLRERLAIVVLGVPLALGACKKKDRDAPPPPAPDAAVIAPPPTIDAASEVAADAGSAVKELDPPTIKGRPAYERGIAVVAPVRRGTRWSARKS